MNDRPKFLPYGRHLIEDDDVAAVAAVLKGEFLTTGPAVKAFEDAFAARTGARFAVACSSGTAALHLAAMALQLKPGDAIVVPSVTFLATANAARYVGADVVFADVDADSGLLTPEACAAALAVAGVRARAIFPVHLNGQCPDLPALGTLARARGLTVVEDACHALGGTYDGAGGRRVAIGGCADSAMATFSFHPVKTIAMGEGGAVTTGDRQLAERLRLLRNHGMVREARRFQVREQAFDADGQPNPWYYEMPEPGFNHRASDIQCALGLSQLGKLDRFVAARRALVAAYDRALASLAPLVQPLPRVPWCDGAWHLYVARIDFKKAGATRAKVMRALQQEGIGTQVHYLPVHRQPYYRQLYGELRLPGADAYYERALALPLFVGMTEDDVARVAGALGRILKGAP
jgi:UDP-4-amino-4,6-dideoxy-N-acetyl-beta-L-altrosamine transaminase